MAPVGLFRARHGAFDALDTRTGEVRHCGGLASRPRGRLADADPPSSSPASPAIPQALVQRLRDEHGQLVAFAAGSRLRTRLVPADLRAALCLALACLPGARATEGVETSTAWRASPRPRRRATRTELTLDPSTASSPVSADTVRTGSRTGLAAGTVDQLHGVRTAVVNAEGATTA